MRDLARQAADRLADLGLQAWEVMARRSDELSLGARRGTIETSTKSSQAGLAVRAFKDQRSGMAYTYRLTPEDIGEACRRAAELAASADQEPALGDDCALAAQPEDLPRVEVFDRAGIETPTQAKMDLVFNLEKTALDYDSRVVKVRQAEYDETIGRTWLLNSCGLDVFMERTSFAMSVGLLAQAGEESQMGWDFDQSPFLSNLDGDRVGRRAAEQAVGQLGARRAKTGGCPVVLDNATAGQFLSVLAGAFLAENVQKGKSLLAGKLDQEVVSPKLTIIDDGLRPQGGGSRPCDDEGTPQQRTELLVEGRLTGYLHDRLSAAREGGNSRSTGNGLRGSPKTPPGAGVTNLYISPGQGDLDDLIAQAGEGLLITDVMGLHTADPVSGDFSLGASGHWLEGGRRAYPVQGAAVSGNLLDLLGRVETVGGDLRFLGRIGAPSLLIGRVDVAG